MNAQVGHQLWPPLLPREHGGWAMLFVPLVVGSLAGPHLGPDVVIVICTALAAYLMRWPLTLAAKGRGAVAPHLFMWAMIYGGLAALGAGWLVLGREQWILVPLGAASTLLLGIHLLLAARRAEMSTSGELLGIAGLSLGGPAAYVVAGGTMPVVAIGLWLLNWLYFGGTVFYIKLKVRVQPRRIAPRDVWERLQVGWVTIMYHVLVLLVAVILVSLQWVPPLAPVAYVPVLCKAVYGVVSWARGVNMKRLGVTEIVHSIIFALVLIAAYG